MGGAEAVLEDMLVQVMENDVIGDVCGEVAALPEASVRIALADMLEILLDFAR